VSNWRILPAIGMLSLGAAWGDERAAKTGRPIRDWNSVSSSCRPKDNAEKIEQLFYTADGNEQLGIPHFNGSDVGGWKPDGSYSFVGWTEVRCDLGCLQEFKNTCK
jgi:hypothetical protein